MVELLNPFSLPNSRQNLALCRCPIWILGPIHVYRMVSLIVNYEEVNMSIFCAICTFIIIIESQEKVLALQKLLKEVRQLIKSSPNTLEKEEILNLSTHLQDLMSVISKNIQLPGVPKSHAAQEMVAAPSQLDIASVLTPPQTITDDYNSNTEELSQSLSLPEVIDDDELPELDEPLLKRRRESEAVVQSLDKQKTFSCGISYTGDHKEKEFSDNAKKKIKAALPALKKHVHLFHYMVFATNDRIYCEHCKECPNDFKY